MNLQESVQMYLETILVLSGKLPIVRAIDVAEDMGYSKPSVSRAVGVLPLQKDRRFAKVSVPLASLVKDRISSAAGIDRLAVRAQLLGKHRSGNHAIGRQALELSVAGTKKRAIEL